MRFALLVAWTHLRPNDQIGIRAMSLIAISGVLIGVAALIIVLSVAEGFEREMRGRILLTDAHLRVTSKAPIADGTALAESIAKADGVVAAAPYRDTEMVIQGAGGITGVMLYGVSVQRPEIRDRYLTHAVPGGPPEPFQPGGDLPGILLGVWLAEAIGAHVGDMVLVQAPSLGGGRAQFEVTRLIETRDYVFDSKRAVVSAAAAEVLLGPGTDGVEAYLSDPEQAAAVTTVLQADLGEGVVVEHWKARNASLFEMLALQKTVMGLIMSLVTVVAGMNIIGFLIIDVVHRTREIAVLQVLGASVRQIRQIFLVQGLLIGSVGAGLGLAVGMLGCEVLRRYPLQLDEEVYIITTIPVAVDPIDTAAVVLLAITVSMVCTLYPVSLAANVAPLAGLRSG